MNIQGCVFGALEKPMKKRYDNKYCNPYTHKHKIVCVFPVVLSGCRRLYHRGVSPQRPTGSLFFMIFLTPRPPYSFLVVLFNNQPRGGRQMKITATIIGIIIIGLNISSGYANEVTNCENGYYLSCDEMNRNCECIKCPDLMTIAQCDIKGLLCATGYYQNGPSSCALCPQMTDDAGNPLWNDKEYEDGDNPARYTTAAYGATSIDECDTKPSGTYYGHSQSGYFTYKIKDNKTTKTYTTCKAGYYLNDTTCMRCRAPMTTPDLNTWSACGCDIGYYMDSDKCVRCPEISGHYSDDKKTPAYGTTTGIGAIKITACIMPAGTYWDDIGLFELDSPCSYVGQQ